MTGRGRVAPIPLEPAIARSGRDLSTAHLPALRLDKCFAHDDKVVSSEALLVSEEAAPEQRDFERAEVAGIHSTVKRALLQLEVC